MRASKEHRERQLLGPTGHQLYPPVHSRPRHVQAALGQHAPGQIHADDVGMRPRGELQGDAGRSRRHVEHPARRRGHDVVDHGPPPPAVLPHGEDLGQAVVAPGQRREQFLGEPVPFARVVRHRVTSEGGKSSLQFWRARPAQGDSRSEARKGSAARSPRPGHVPLPDSLAMTHSGPHRGPLGPEVLADRTIWPPVVTTSSTIKRRIAAMLPPSQILSVRYFFACLPTRGPADRSPPTAGGQGNPAEFQTGQPRRSRVEP